MKWSVRIFVVLLLMALATQVVSAFSYDPVQPWRYIPHLLSADVTITATPNWGGPGAPENFTLTYVSETEVGITWDIGTNADNTLIRAKYGEYPEDTTDGYQVYYGAGTSTSDTGVNFDASLDTVYYRAWSTNTIGTSTDYAEGNLEGRVVLILCTIILILGLTAVAYYSRWGILLFFSGMAIMIYGFTISSDNLYLSIVVALFGFSTVIYAFMPKRKAG